VIVTHGFVSFTEVGVGEHHSYNRWHLFDHLPEQLQLAGVVWGQRWVLPPSLHPFRRASAPLDRVHYVTLYLLADPIEQTLIEFRALGARLRAEDRFHLHRTSHLSGALSVRDRAASPHALVSADVVPYRPNTGAHVRLTTRPAPVATLTDVDGVAGAWTFVADEHGPAALRDVTVEWRWLDQPVEDIAPALAVHGNAEDDDFSATLAAIDPWGAWDWFDALR
jgi:hypothetical protein